MHIAYPIELQDEALRNAVSKSLNGQQVKKIGVKMITPHRTTLAAMWFGGYMLVTEGNAGYVHHYQIANANIDTFTGNCGIVALGQVWVRPPVPGLEKLWLKILEDVTCRWGGYSYFVGSDGQSSGWRTKSYIEQHGTGWTVVPLKENRRMSVSRSSPQMLALMYKHLEPKEYENGEKWWQGIVPIV